MHKSQSTLTIILFCLLLLSSLNGCNMPSATSNEKNVAKNESLTTTTEMKGQPTSSDNNKISLNVQDLEIDGKNFQIVTIDPKLYQLEIFENSMPPDAQSIRTIHEDQNSLLSFNGGFFTEKFEPTGLLISKGKLLHPSSKADLLNGIIAVDYNSTPKLYTPEELEKHMQTNPGHIEFGLQNGPVLIKNGTIQIKTDTGKLAARTALGIDKNNVLKLIILRQSLFQSDNLLSLYEFAHFMQEKPELKKLEIVDLLNLDGGPSTGFVIGDDYYPELSRVQNIVLTKKR